MNIGVLKEKEPEKRVALLPSQVSHFTSLKLDIMIEEGAGKGSYAGDKEYSEAGAGIVKRDDILKKADIILSVSAPDSSTLKKISKGKILIGTLNALSDKSMVTTLRDSGVTAFSLELIPRISRAQSMDVLSNMATVAGYKAVLRAASELPRFFPMFMTAAGTIKPAKVLILGAGVAGLQAIATSRKLGAVVEVFDVRSDVKEQVQSLGGKFIEVEGATEDKSAGGYAVEQTEEYKKRQSEMIQKHASNADVVICTAQIPGKKAPVLVKKETVSAMKPGSVIIDLAASTGGNCELTENGKTVEKDGVRIVGESNFPSLMPSDASKMYGTNLINFSSLLFDKEGTFKLDMEDEIVSGTCLTKDGEVINERIKSVLNL
ncbi:MAG: Re/Si-specific NAD(P)(+) transhydrogenase subunit alpha [Bacteroidales bacterium]|nr:Re/Si-specific NAD(P)(+) transhydrogenase subunit alpha [Bacteroidales bacterium]